MLAKKSLVFLSYFFLPLDESQSLHARFRARKADTPANKITCSKGAGATPPAAPPVSACRHGPLEVMLNLVGLDSKAPAPPERCCWSLW